MPTKPLSFATTSAFEILGPIMVGPSSSHTAGALRCARVAATLLEGEPTHVTFTLWNSFAHTYRGHGTDRALVAGVLGLDTDDERIRDAFSLAKGKGLDYKFVIGGDDPSIHPNTVDIALESSKGSSCNVRGESLGGGKMRISAINGVHVEISGLYTTLFVAHLDAPGALAALTGALAKAHMNIAFCRTYRTEQGGHAYSVFETDGAPQHGVLPIVRSLDLVTYATFIELPGSVATLGPGISVPDLFDDAAQLLQACVEHDSNIGHVMRMREERMVGADRARRCMDRVINVMREETTKPLVDPQRSLGGFLNGEAQRVHLGSALHAPSLLGSTQTEAVARAMAVLERSATMGVIVAAPTAGSAGVVPGCVLAVAPKLAHDRDAIDTMIEEALYCAAAVGLILSTSACVAGAEGGCQAEVGSAAAMAAAALVQMHGGTPAQALDAASITLSNLLGLVCDPVGGLVEVPCQNRNAIGVAAAFTSAQLVLSGVHALVPLDEMAKVMLNVGHALPSSLRETAKGGIAVAPSALRACDRCGMCMA